MAIKYTNNSIPRTSQIYPNFDFWYENLATLRRGIKGETAVELKRLYRSISAPKGEQSNLKVPKLSLASCKCKQQTEARDRCYDF
jgi:hypothetical protein